MTAPREDRQQGLALVFVLWMIALLALLAVNFLHETGTQLQIARNQYEHARVRALADTGVSLAIIEMLDRTSATPLRLDGSVRELPYGGETIRLRLQDEAGKIDLNHAPEDVLSNLFQVVAKDDEDIGDFAVSIAAWKERRLAQWQGPDGAPPNIASGPFLAVEELREVRGVTPDLYDRVSPFLTVLSQSAGIDPLSAPREVLLSLPGADQRTIDAYVAAREAFGPVPNALPRLSGLEPYLIQQQSPQTVSIASEASISPSIRFTREATVSLIALEGQPYRFVRWRQGNAD